MEWGGDLPLLYASNIKGACRGPFFDPFPSRGNYWLQGWNDLDVVVQQRSIVTSQMIPDQITLLRFFSVTLLFHPKHFEQLKGPISHKRYHGQSSKTAPPLQIVKDALLHHGNIREPHRPNIVIIMGLVGLLAKVVSIQPPSEALLFVAFDDFVFNIDFETLIQIIKKHSCEQARDTGANDADLERLGAVIFASPWRWEALYYGGELVATLWRWLDQVSLDFVGAVVGGLYQD